MGNKPAKEQNTNPIEVVNWVNKSCYNYKNMLLESNRITANKGYIVAFGNEPLKKNFKFTVQIETNTEEVSIGINTILNAPNTKWLNYALLFGEPYETEDMFKKNDIVCVMGNFDKGEIKLEVNGKVSRQKTDERMLEEIIWVPCIRLSEGSSVIILG